MEYTILTEAGVPAVTAVRNFPAKGFIKKGLNGRLAEHVNKSMENIYLYTGVSAHIVSTVSQNACIVETAVITITSNSALKTLKASLTTLISGGRVWGLKGVVSR